MAEDMQTETTQDVLELISMEDSYHGASGASRRDAPRPYLVPVVFDRDEAKEETEGLEGGYMFTCCH